MKKIYVAGAYSGDNIHQILENMRIGLSFSSRLLTMGYAVYSPWTDFQLFLVDYYIPKISDQQIKEASLEWLKVSDAMFVVPNERNHLSKGLQYEIQKAKELSIPIFYSTKKMNEYFKKQHYDISYEE